MHHHLPRCRVKTPLSRMNWTHPAVPGAGARISPIHRHVHAFSPLSFSLHSRRNHHVRVENFFALLL
jgi:hypothetical protein